MAEIFPCDIVYGVGRDTTNCLQCPSRPQEVDVIVCTYDIFRHFAQTDFYAVMVSFVLPLGAVVVLSFVAVKLYNYLKNIVASGG